MIGVGPQAEKGKVKGKKTRKAQNLKVGEMVSIRLHRLGRTAKNPTISPSFSEKKKRGKETRVGRIKGKAKPPSVLIDSQKKKREGQWWSN